MSIQMQCPILKIEPLNPYAWSIRVYAGEMARAARPGQFVHIKCGHSRLLRRPISICDREGEVLRMVFEVRGEGTEWLSRRREGDCLDILGPLGHGFAVEGKKLLLVGGGIGVPPMLCVARNAPGEVHVVLGFRDRERAMLLEEFDAQADTVTVTSDDGSIGARGLVSGPVEALLSGGGFDGVLACGPKPMLRSIFQVAQGYGVPCQVSMEERMGCGVGACLVCACQTADGAMKHVCKDGPVFRAEEVAWDD
jgi:dihydroorotate dehydrogenase electron transfer subunit